MKFLILITLVSVCYARPQGFLADTPEVTAEKMKFFQLYNDAARAAALAPDIHIYGNHPVREVVQHHIPAPYQQHAIHFAPHQPSRTTFKWTGPLASNVPAGLPGSGNVRNTVEVDAAISQFNKAYAAALVATGAAPGPRTDQFYQQTNPAHFPGFTHV